MQRLHEKVNYNIFELIGIIFLFRLIVNICGFIIVKTILKFYDISVFIPFTSTYRYGDTAAFISGLICTPFATGSVLRNTVFIRHSNGKWLYGPFAIFLMVFAIWTNEHYSHSGNVAVAIIIICVIFLLASIRNLKMIRKGSVAWIVFLSCALLFTSLEIGTALWYRDAFFIETYNDNSYVDLLDIQEHVYLLRCDINETNNVVSITLRRGDYIVLDKGKLANGKQEYSKFSEVQVTERIIGR